MTTHNGLDRAAARSVQHRIIKASAGSGKTFRLSSRYIILLALGSAPETILATTFTRKAAGEILERVLRRLAGAGRDAGTASSLSRELSEDLGVPVDLPVEVIRSILKRLCVAIHRVSIGTLDSYFHRLASCFRLELGMPADPNLLAEGSAAATELRARALQELMEEQTPQENLSRIRILEQDSARSAVAQPLDDVLKGVRDLLLESEPDAWTRLPLVGNPLTELQLAALTAEFAGLAQASGALLSKACLKVIAAIESRAWTSCMKSGPLDKMLKGETTYGKQLLADAQFAPFRTYRDHVAAVLSRQLRDQTRATYELAADFETRFARVLKSEETLFYSDIPRLLSGIMADPDSELGLLIRYRLDGHVKHLLLDEFQDTSPEQWNVLRPLAQEIVSEGEPAESGRSFFCVGDIKQAIYGWRGGNARIFDRVQHDLHLGNECVSTLDVSRRSSQAVLDVVDAVFQSLDTNPALSRYPATGLRWKQGFPVHTAFDTTLEGYAELATSPESSAPTAGNDEGDDGSGKSAIHYRYVAGRIKEMTRERPDCTVGVLVRTNATAQSMLSRLRRMGVAASGESGNPLDVEPAVSVILSALLMADAPGHTAVAWHVFNSPLASSLRLEAMTAGCRVAVAAAIRERVATEGLAAVVAEWATVMAAHSGPAGGAVFRLERLVEMAETFVPRTPLRTSEFVRTVKDTSIEEPSPARVQVMSIHKSKGLEFDIVVLPELLKDIGKVSSPLLVARDDQSKPMALTRAGDAVSRSLIAPLDAVHEEEVDRRLDDDLAGLYVAMTRARQALYMIVPPLVATKNQFGTWGYTNQTLATLLRRSLSRLHDTESTAGNQVLFETGKKDWVFRKKDESAKQVDRAGAGGPVILAPCTGPPRRGRPVVAPSALVQKQRFTVDHLVRSGTSRARERGLLIHAWFQAVEWLGKPGDLPQDAVLRESARGVLPGADSVLVDATLKEFHDLVSKPWIIDALSRPKEADVEIWRERPFLVEDGDRLVHGQWDRVVVIRESGKPVRAHLIDFKTDRIDDKTSVDEKMTHYRPQIAAYTRALARMLGIDPAAVSAGLLFVEKSFVRM